jgi:hypothetical protein
MWRLENLKMGKFGDVEMWRFGDVTLKPAAGDLNQRSDLNH